MKEPTGGEALREARGIVFDLDGTLIDSYEAIAESLNTALAGLGRSALPQERVRTMVGRGLETLIERALDGEGGVRPGEIERAVGLFREHYDRVCVSKTSLLPDVGATLSALKGRGYRMAVATNKPSYFAKRLLDALSVGPMLDIVLGPDLVEHHKPHPEMVLAALAAMGLAPSEAVYVGDMEVDVQTARAAGVKVIVLPTGSCSPEELDRAGADLVLASFAALLDVLPGPLREPRPGEDACADF
jgi:2-phosphoglycolate phosphatase